MANSAKKDKLPEISDKILSKYLEKQSALEKAKLEVKALAKDIEGLTKDITELLSIGAVCPGSFEAIMIAEASDTKPSWKEIALKYAKDLGRDPSDVERDGAAEAQSRRSISYRVHVQAKQEI